MFSYTLHQKWVLKGLHYIKLHVGFVCCVCCVEKLFFFKKDTSREKYDHYMTKMILSLWTIHVFSLEIDDIDEHQLYNKVGTNVKRESMNITRNYKLHKLMTNLATMR